MPYGGGVNHPLIKKIKENYKTNKNINAMRNYFKMTEREFADIKNGASVRMVDCSRENLVVKMSGSNVIMFMGEKSVVIGSTETLTNENLVKSINKNLVLYLKDKYDWGCVYEYPWGYKYREREEMTEKERKELTLAWIINVINEGDIFGSYERFGTEEEEECTTFEINLAILQETIKLDYIFNEDFGELIPENDIIRLEDSYGNMVEYELCEVDNPMYYFDFKDDLYTALTNLMKKTVEYVIYEFKR